MALRSVCPFVCIRCCWVGNFTSKRNAPSLQAPRAETRLTVYRALRSFGPCRGLTHPEGCIRPSRQYHMARRDGDCFLCQRATFYWHNSGANSLQKCMRIFEKILHKILNISRPCGQILMKSCPAGAKTMWIVILKARGPGKFCSSRTAGTKVGKIDKIFQKSALW